MLKILLSSHMLTNSAMCFIDILRVFQGRLRGGPRFKGCSSSRYLKEVQRVFQGSAKDILKKIKGCTEIVKCILSKFYKKFQGSFKIVSIKFCFAILS